MLEWKHLQLSSQDYQNYINNQDEEIMKINEGNLTEWRQLYHEIQKRSLLNKNIKRTILFYENNMKRLTGDTNLKSNPKQMKRLYAQYNNELKVKITELYDQLGMLHINNISTTVELVISRLLTIEQDLFRLMLQNELKIYSLQDKILEFELNKKQNICNSCTEHIQKTKFKYLKNQIYASDQINAETQKQDKFQSQGQMIRRYMRQQVKKQDHQYQIHRYNYMNAVEQVLRNKQKALRCTNTPLQNILTQYLQQILQILQSKKLNFTPKNINQFERVSRSYQNIEDMKKLFNHQGFKNNVTSSLQKPFNNFALKIERIVQNCLNGTKGEVTEMQVQTSYIKQFDVIKNLQKQNNRLNSEISMIRGSKMKMQNQLIFNLQVLHKSQTKNNQYSNKIKQLELEIKRVETDKNTIISSLKQIIQGYKQEKSSLIGTNLSQKSNLIHDKKKLQIQLNRIKIQKSIQKTLDKIQRQTQTENDEYYKKLNGKQKQNTQRVYKQNKKNSIQAKSHKRISIKLQPFQKNQQNILLKTPIKTAQIMQVDETQAAPDKNLNTINYNMNIINQAQKIARYSHQQSKISVSRQNSAAKNKSSIKKVGKKQIALKCYTINPLRLPNGQDLQQISHQFNLQQISDKFHLQNHKLNLQTHNLNSSQQKRQSLQNYNPRKDIKKIGTSRRGHFYHNSDLMDRSVQKKIYQLHHLDIPKISAKQYLQTQVLPPQDVNKHNQKYHNKIKNNHSSPQQSALNSMEINTKNYHNHPHLKEQRQIEYHNQNSSLYCKSLSIDKIIDICKQNYQQLNKIEAFAKINQFYSKISQKVSSYSTKERMIIKETNDNKIIKIGKQGTDLFFSNQQSMNYEKKIGLWAELDNYIMINNNFSAQCQKIQLYFMKIKQSQPIFHKECIIFLFQPHIYMNECKIKVKNEITKQKNTQLRMMDDHTWIKKLFQKLFTVHKLVHKKCNHVSNFLQRIGFYNQ